MVEGEAITTRGAENGKWFYAWTIYFLAELWNSHIFMGRWNTVALLSRWSLQNSTWQKALYVQRKRLSCHSRWFHEQNQIEVKWLRKTSKRSSWSETTSFLDQQSELNYLKHLKPYKNRYQKYAMRRRRRHKIRLKDHFQHLVFTWCALNQLWSTFRQSNSSWNSFSLCFS